MTVVGEWTTPCALYTTILNPGIYRLEVWGAQGGTYSSINYGGKGGYAKGEITLKQKTTVFINVGESGEKKEGGCNGGGSSSSDKTAGGGGTDIRIKENSLYSRVIVAGGGGGSGAGSNGGDEIGGYGGGLRGGDGQHDYLQYPGKGADENGPATVCADGVTTTCASGSFGSGGPGTTSKSYSGGGGGGWYGGSGSNDNDPGGGGSGFVFVPGAPIPSEYKLGTSYFLNYAELIAGNQNIPSFENAEEKVVGRSGDGAARITFIRAFSNRANYSCKGMSRGPTFVYHIIALLCNSF